MIKIIIVLVLVTSDLFAQNLVPNPGFTNYSLCPTSQNQLHRAYPWYNPSVFPSTPDYFHTCSNTVPTSVLFYQNDHSNLNGGFAGIVLFGSYPNNPNSREYLQVELVSPLIQGSHYCVEFYCNLIEQVGIAIADIGIYFSDSAVFLSTNTNFPAIPQIENPSSSFLTDTLNWTQISGIYTAIGGEKFITIGNFRDSTSTHALQLDTTAPQYSYYLIDDVSVINCDSLFIGLPEQASARDINVYPNPASNSVTFETSLQGGHLMIMDVTGKEVMNIKCKNGVTTINTESFTSGIYFYSYSSSTQSPIMGRLSIIK